MNKRVLVTSKDFLSTSAQANHIQCFKLLTPFLPLQKTGSQPRGYSGKELQLIKACRSAPFVAIHNLLDFFEQDHKLFVRPEMRALFLDLLLQVDIEVCAKLPHGTKSSTLLTLELYFDKENQTLPRFFALLQNVKTLASESDALEYYLFILELERIIFAHSNTKLPSVFTHGEMRDLFFRYRFEKKAAFFQEFIGWHKRNRQDFATYLPDLLAMFVLLALNPSLERATMPLFFEMAQQEPALKDKLESLTPHELSELLTDTFEAAGAFFSHDNNWKLSYPVVSTDCVSFDLHTGTLTYNGELYVDMHSVVEEQAGYKAIAQKSAVCDFIPSGTRFVSPSVEMSVASLDSCFVFSISAQLLVDKIGPFGAKLGHWIEPASEYLYIDPLATRTNGALSQCDFPIDAFADTFNHSRFERYRSLGEATPHLVLYDPVAKSCYLSIYSNSTYRTFDLATGLRFSWLSTCIKRKTSVVAIREIEEEVYIQLWVDRGERPKLLEFPRHGLSFTIDEQRFLSREHPGYYWDLAAKRAIPQLPGTLLLQNEEEKPLLFVPNLGWKKVYDPKEPFSRRLLFQVPKGFQETIKYLECQQTSESKNKIRLAHIHAAVGNCTSALTLLSACYQNTNVPQEAIDELIFLIKDTQLSSPNQIAVKMHAAYLLCEAVKLEKKKLQSHRLEELIGPLHASYRRNLPNISKTFLLPTAHEMGVQESCRLKKSTVETSLMQSKWQVPDLPNSSSFIQELPDIEFKASYHPTHPIDRVFHALLRKLLVAQGTGDKAQVVRLMCQTHHFKAKDNNVRQTCLLLARKILKDTPLISLPEEELALYRSEAPITDVHEKLTQTFNSHIKTVKKARTSSVKKSATACISQSHAVDYIKWDCLQQAKMDIDQCFQ